MNCVLDSRYQPLAGDTCLAMNDDIPRGSNRCLYVPYVMCISPPSSLLRVLYYYHSARDD